MGEESACPESWIPSRPTENRFHVKDLRVNNATTTKEEEEDDEAKDEDNEAELELSLDEPEIPSKAVVKDVQNQQQKQAQNGLVQHWEKKNDAPEFPFNYRIHGCVIQAGCLCAGARKGKIVRQKRAMEREWKKLIGAAWCICLEERDDRQQMSEAQFHKVGLCRIVQYYRCQRPPNQHCEERKITSRGRYGIWTSHHNVARLSTGVKAALVFEDDFTILEGRLTLKTLRDLHHNFKHHLPKTWEVFKLGQLTLGGKQIEACTADMSIYRTNSYALHAYIWSQRGACNMANHPFLFIKETNKYNEFDVDCWVNDHFECYACYPQLCGQADTQTNNVNNYNSNILNSMRERIVPILLRQQRKNCNAIDTFLYSILPWIVMAFMMMISFVLFLYVARGACMIMPLLSTVTGQPTISWQPIVGAAVATPTKTNRGTAIP